jgi:Icc-related predicted phosphoesterase
MKIAAMADLHGERPKVDSDTDLVLIAGDIFFGVSIDQDIAYGLGKFKRWLERMPCPVVAIAGNHDFVLRDTNLAHQLPWTYLQDQTTTVNGLVIHGTPWTPTFFDWAFMKEDEFLWGYWSAIPDNVDILLSHGPPYGVCDETFYQGVSGGSVGSKSLRQAVIHKRPKIIICGHIHDGYGFDVIMGEKSILVYNVSIMDEIYAPTNPVTYIRYAEPRLKDG